MAMRGKFDRICRNIDYAIANRGTMKVEVHSTMTRPDFTDDDATDFFYRWGDVRFGGHGMIVAYTNWAEQITPPPESYRPLYTVEGCYRALGSIYVTCEGKVTACCLDPFGKMTFGDLNKQSLRDVYNGDKYVEFRRLHSENRANEVDICRFCTRV